MKGDSTKYLPSTNYTKKGCGILHNNAQPEILGLWAQRVKVFYKKYYLNAQF